MHSARASRDGARGGEVDIRAGPLRLEGASCPGLRRARSGRRDRPARRGRRARRRPQGAGGADYLPRDDVPRVRTSHRRGLDRRSGNRLRSWSRRRAAAFDPGARPHGHRGRRQHERRRWSRRSWRRRRWCRRLSERCGCRWIAARSRRANRRRFRSGQEEHRVDIAVRVRGQSHPEIDVRLRKLRYAAGPHRADDLPLPDRVAAPDGIRAQMHEGDRVAVRGLDRHRLSAPRDGAGE
jgi:hypothetical protein